MLESLENSIENTKNICTYTNMHKLCSSSIAVRVPWLVFSTLTEAPFTENNEYNICTCGGKVEQNNASMCPVPLLVEKMKTE